MEGESVVATMIDVYHNQGLAAAVWVPMYFIIFYLSFVPAGVQLEGEIYRWLLRDLQLEGEILAHNLKIENVHPSIESLSSYLNRILGCTLWSKQTFAIFQYPYQQ